jgi:hypothetical protein
MKRLMIVVANGRGNLGAGSTRARIRRLAIKPEENARWRNLLERKGGV